MITEAAVGTAPEGHTAVWPTLSRVCDMLSQHGEIPSGLLEQVRHMGEVNTLLAQVQTSVASAVNEATRA